MANKALSLLLSAVIFTAGCSATASEESNQTAPKKKVVQVVTVEQQDVVQLRTTGIVTAKQMAWLSFGTAGKISSIRAEKGEHVKSGQVLAEIDTSYQQKAIQAAASQVEEAAARRQRLLTGADQEQIAQQKLRLESARQRLEMARKELEKGERLFQGGVISAAEQEQLQATADQAALEVQQEELSLKQLLAGAKADEVAAANAFYAQASSESERLGQVLAEAKIIAPFSGTITAVEQRVGELSSPGQPVIQLVDMSEVTVSLEVNPDQIQFYQQGEKAQLIGANGERSEAVISFVSPVITGQSGRYRVELTAANESGMWRDGMLVQVEVPRPLDSGILLPLQCVGIDGAERFVLVGNNGVVERKAVKVGQVVGEQIEIVAGLKTGDQVIRQGIYSLAVGEEITVKGE